MQDPSSAFQGVKPHFPEQEQLKCPRCESTNTKFCYYNNYNLSQPRHFCKNCRRYWTKGGALRNIPVGGGSRKNNKRSSNAKRPSSSSSTSSVSSPPVSSSSSAAQKSDAPGIYAPAGDQDRRMLDIGGSFSSLLSGSGQFGSLLEGLNPTNSSVRGVPLTAFSEMPNLNSESARTPAMEMQSNGNSESFLGIQTGDSSCWNASNGWPDLAIYTPGSTFQ